jgi:DNA-binding LacI/PurR family transcriptional regulator
MKPARHTHKVSIREVARAAGVSSSTVSHVLSGKRPISPAVCKKVRRVVDRLGYRAHATARHLAQRKTGQLGLVVREVSSSVTGALLEHMEASCRRSGYKMLLGIAHDDADLALSYISEFASGLADGVLNLVPGIGVAQAALAGPGVPVLTYLRPHPESPVLFDKRAATELMMEHLWALGHRRIALVWALDLAPEQHRDPKELGYRSFLERMGVTFDERLLLPTREGEPVGPLAEAALRCGATALFATSDTRAAELIRWAHDTGRHVPRDLSIAGFDDAPIAASLVPALTTIALPLAELAEKTIRALVDRIEGRLALAQEILPPRLIIRQSTHNFLAEKTPQGK